MKYQFKNEAEAMDIRIYDEISSDDFWGDVVTAKMINDQLDEAKGKPLNIHINSYGGEVFEGFAIYNNLMNYGGHIEVFIDGICASIASVIAMAGNKIHMNKASMMMIHNASGVAYGDAEEMKKVVSALEQINDVIRGVYKDRTGLEEDVLKDYMDKETFFKPEECVELGFADDIIDMETEDKPTQTAMENLIQSLSDRLNQLNEVKDMVIEAPVQVDVRTDDETKALNKKFDWLKNGGIF